MTALQNVNSTLNTSYDDIDDVSRAEITLVLDIMQDKLDDREETQ